MAQRPKDIGTSAETAVVRYLREFGLPSDRIALHGTDDCGDVWVISQSQIIIEVKAGKTAERASANLIKSWMDDTERERKNAGANLGILVVKRKGVGHARCGGWAAYMHYWAAADLLGAAFPDEYALLPISTQLSYLANPMLDYWGREG